MSRNLKDIVDEGFAKLAVYSDKRKELVQRSASLSTGSAELQEQAVERLKGVDAEFREEMHARTQQAERYLEQTLAQINQDNGAYLESLRQRLTLELAKAKDNLLHEKVRKTDALSEKFDALLNPLERVLAAGSTDLRLESTRLIADLESICKQGHAHLQNMEADCKNKLTDCEQDVLRRFSKDFTDLLSEIDKERKERNAELEKAANDQSKQSSKLAKQIDSEVEKIAEEQLDEFQSTDEKVRESLLKTYESLLSTGRSSLSEHSTQSSEKLKESCQKTAKILDEKFDDCKKVAESAAEELQKYLSQTDDAIRTNAISRSDRMKMAILFGGDLDSKDLVANNPLADLPQEMQELSKQFKADLQKLEDAQTEKAKAISESIESNWHSLDASISEKLLDLLNTQEKEFIEQERSLLAQIEKLEQAVIELCAMLSDGENADDGGSKSGGPR